LAGRPSKKGHFGSPKKATWTCKQTTEQDQELLGFIKTQQAYSDDYLLHTRTDRTIPQYI